MDSICGRGVVFGADYFWNPRRKRSPSCRRVGLQRVRIRCSDVLIIPGFYAEGEYDLSGSTIGVVKKDKIIDGKDIVEGDILIGLPSSGFHSNGFSLATR